MVQREAPQPEPVQQVLRGVRQLGDALLTEEPRQPLQRVRRAEDAVDVLRIRLLLARLVQREQIPAQRIEDLRGLGDELRQRLAAGRHSGFRKRLRSASRSSGRNGFTRYPSAPSASPRERSCSRPSVVMMMSGTSR